MSAIRPLPPRPSLEFERKEYGFASWTRLVRYFEGVERVLHRTPCAVNPGLGRPEWYPKLVQQIMEGHQRRRHPAIKKLSAYVPRFYGLSPDEVVDLAVTEQDAQLALARGEGFLSWDSLMSAVNTRFAEARQPKESETPRRRAYKAMRDGDLSQLQMVVREHPELLTPTAHETATGMHLLSQAFSTEYHTPHLRADRSRMQPIIDWLAHMGFDVQRELNERLCGDMRMTADEVEYLIGRGANANWVAPNGHSVLEHAIVRYRNPDSLDQLAQHATVREPALWIAAGLGDVVGVHSFLDGNARPTAAARTHRPRFDAIGPQRWPQLGDNDDDVLMEAATLAFENSRTAVMEYLISRGFPIDTLRWDMPFVVMAVGNKKVAMVETLVRNGANVDHRGRVNGSAREMAREMLEHEPHDADRRRIAELCGLDVDAILPARQARFNSTP